MKYYLYAFGAILCWASLPAATGSGLKTLDTEELMFMSFVSAAFYLYVQNILQNRTFRIFIPSTKVILIGIWGIFLYHYIYYKAMENAPVAECAVLATTWSFWIVVFASLLSLKKLTLPVFFTALAGLFGAALVILSGRNFSFDPEYIFGYGLALLCGLIWSSFTVSLPLLNKDERDPMIFFTITAALISSIIYILKGNYIIPDNKALYSAFYLGCVPLGLSFFLWNRALPGNLTVIGYMSYLAPPLAVLLVSIINGQKIHNQVILGMLIIIAASALGNYFSRKSAEFKSEIS